MWGECICEFTPKVIPIKVKSEAFPVEPTWDLVTSPYDQGGMHYYLLQQLLEMGNQAKPDFVDKDHDEYYQSAAELEGVQQGHTKIRTAVYSNRRVKDLEFKKNSTDGKYEISKEGETEFLCTSFDGDGMTEAKQKRLAQVTEKMAAVLKLYHGPSATEAQKKVWSEEYFKLQAEKDRLNSMSSNFSQPVLSKDGSEVAFVTGQSLKVAKITGPGRCKVETYLGYRTNKVGFSYPEKGKKSKIAFTAQGVTVDAGTSDQRTLNGVYIYDRDTKKTTQISLTKDPMMIDGPRNSASPERNMTAFELTRYLDYCSEMLSLTAKIAALYAEASQDASVVDAVSDLSTLTSNLSAKILQKIAMVQSYSLANHANS